MLRRPALLAVLALAGPGLAACGGAPDDTPQAVAQRYVASDDPDKCELVLPETLERATGRQGADALRSCEEDVRRQGKPASVKVVEYEVERLRGVAEVELVADERPELLRLVKRGESWLISELPDP